MWEKENLRIALSGDDYAATRHVPEIEEDLWLAAACPFGCQFRCTNEDCASLSLVSGMVATRQVEECGCRSCLERGYHYSFSLAPSQVSLAPHLIQLPHGTSEALRLTLEDAFRACYGPPSAALNRLRVALEQWTQDASLRLGVNIPSAGTLDTRLSKLKGSLSPTQYALTTEIRKAGNAGSHKFAVAPAKVLECLAAFDALLNQA